MGHGHPGGGHTAAVTVHAGRAPPRSCGRYRAPAEDLIFQSGIAAMVCATAAVSFLA